MKKCAMVILITAITLSGSVSIVLAQGEGATPTKPAGISVTGINYPLLQSLAKDEIASANPVYAKLHALKVTTAKTLDGNVMPELAGKTLYYLPSRAATKLLTGESADNAEVTILGRYFAAESALLVEEVQGGATEQGWTVQKLGEKSNVQDLGLDEDEK